MMDSQGLRSTELAVIISYPTSTSAIIVRYQNIAKQPKITIKTPTKIARTLPNMKTMAVMAQIPRCILANENS